MAEANTNAATTAPAPVVTTNDLTARLAKRFEGEATLSTINAVVGEFLRLTGDAVASGSKVALTHFMTAERVDIPARVRRNPKTGEPLDCPPTRTVRLYAAKRVVDAAKAA